MTAPFLRSRSTAQATVTGITSSISLFTLRMLAMAMAPKATWDRLSPIKEKRLSTRVTPSREEHRAISAPAIRA